MLEDMILIWKFKQGSADALRTIYEKYRDTMLTIATALCNDVHTAEDAVQDCFISFARAGKHLKLNGSLKAYLTTSVVNRLRDRHRRSSYRPVTMENVDLPASQNENPEALAIGHELIQSITNALAEIGHEEREVVVLRTRGGMTYKEIAYMQEVSIPTVQRRYQSGLDKLRALLNGEADQ